MVAEEEYVKIPIKDLDRMLEMIYDIIEKIDKMLEDGERSWDENPAPGA